MQGQERERKEPSEFNVIVKAKDLVKHTFYDHEQHGALPEEIPLYAGEPHTGKSG